MPPKKKKLVKKKKIKGISSPKKPNMINLDEYQKAVNAITKSTSVKRPSSSQKVVVFVENSNKNKINPPSHRLSNVTTTGTINQDKRKTATGIKSAVTSKDNNEGLKRIFTPFNRFASSFPRTTDQKTHKTRMPCENSYRYLGLSPKEKSYIISICQSRPCRYAKLKSMATSAIRNKQIFTVYGNCNAVRTALIGRGWVEKMTPIKMNLSKIRNRACTCKDKNDITNEIERLLLSNLVEKCQPNFIWRTTEHNTTTIDMNEQTVIVNKLKIDALWTSKQGLCSSMKRNYWFYIENEAEVDGPRTYNTCEAGETEGFVKDFQITACTSLLKWILSMVANDRPVFVETGKISMNVVIFALNRCKEYLSRKQNKDIDRSIPTASTHQWTVFLKKYYRVISKEDVFTSDTDNSLPFYIRYAKFLLKEMHRYRPQLSCEGCHNIWIMKPAHCSRGRGIRMASKLAVITDLLNKANTKYVVQKYIEEPLLIHETKFDIRQYYLITSTYPLEIWMYQNCYLKFSSQKYNLKSYHESIHLTNNAVQKKYKNCTGRHRDLPQSNMWDLEKYKTYLTKIGRAKVWDNIIYPGMRKCIIGIMLSCQDSLSVCKNRFELYGCDFILDKEYKPWLIEINSCPDLNATTGVTAKICPAVISDIIKVVIDNANDPNASTGGFECIYRQPITPPKYGGVADLVARGFGLKNDYFYKGSIPIKESFYDDNVEKERDVKSVLSKIKHDIYDTDVMVEPEEVSECNSKKEICTQNTESEYELSRAASIVTEQLEELISRITLEHTHSTKSIICLELSYSSNILSPIQSIESENIIIGSKQKYEYDYEPIILKSRSQYSFAEFVNNGHSFGFSQLEDSYSEKSSITNFRPLKSMMQHTSNALRQISSEKQYSYEKIILPTATKIIKFIKEKQQYGIFIPEDCQ